MFKNNSKDKTKNITAIIFLVLIGFMALSHGFRNHFLNIFFLIAFGYHFVFPRLKRFSLSSVDLAILRLLVAFMKESDMLYNDIKRNILNLYKSYDEKKIETEILNAYNGSVTIGNECLKIKDTNHKIRFFVGKYLFEIAAIDRVITKEEESRISYIFQKLNIHPNIYARMKASYIRLGVREEREFQKASDNQYNSLQSLYNAYKVLGLLPNAKLSEIKAAYRKLVKKYHPDKFENNNMEFVNSAEDKFIEITKAYEYIKNHKNI